MLSGLLTLALAAAAAAPTPARFKAGNLPALPGPTVVGGGEVLLEVEVEPRGDVDEVGVLRSSPPYDEALRGAVAGWTFEPARSPRGTAVRSRVLVAGWFRPPTVSGPAPGTPPRDVAAASAAVAFPSVAVPAMYPVAGRGDAVVLAEAHVAADGAVTAVEVVRSGGAAFDAAARQALAAWRFRPPRIDGAAAPARVYVVFGFREPVAAPAPPR